MKMTPRRLATLFLAVGAVLCLEPARLCAAPTPRESARVKVAEGAKLLEQKKFAEALKAFEEAHAIFPSPKINFNLGLAYGGMGKNARALGAFEQFLREASDASPENIAQARAEVERLSKLVAFVSITCDVVGADVFLDGVAIGSTPVEKRVPVDPGAHDLVIRSRDFGSRSKAFSATSGENAEIKLELRPSSPIVLASPPPAAGEPVVPGPATTPILGGRAGGTARGTTLLSVARWTAAGTAATALGVGFYFNLRSISKRDEFDKTGCFETEGGGFGGPANCTSLASDFDTAKKVSIGSYVAGGALAATALVLFLVDIDTGSSTIHAGAAGFPLGATYAKRF